MQQRIEQCRRLADLIHNAEVSQSLLEMAKQIEVDLKKLEADEAEGRQV